MNRTTPECESSRTADHGSRATERTIFTDHRSPITDHLEIRRTPLINSLLGVDLGYPREINLAIHPSDEMLRYQTELYDGDGDRGLAGYLESGRWAARMTEQVVAWRFGGSDAVEILDFASGYGRVTRHLLRWLDRARLTVSDLMAPAVEFQRRAFGVDGVVSTPDPERLHIHRDFDVVQSISLFSHLPEPLFRRWLRALWACTRPGGLMIFSVHGASLLTGGCGGARFVYVPASENDVLDSEAYGSTWVTNGFVEEAIENELDAFSYRRLPRGLCGYQDVYVVAKEKDIDLSGCDFDPGVEGYVDIVEFGPDFGLRCSGWAASIGRAHEIDSIDLLINDEIVGSAELGEPRPDVAAALGDHRLALAGWSLEAQLGPSISYGHDAAVLLARSRGDRTILTMGCVHSLVAETTRRRLTALTAESSR